MKKKVHSKHSDEDLQHDHARPNLSNSQLPRTTRRFNTGDHDTTSTSGRPRNRNTSDVVNGCEFGGKVVAIWRKEAAVLYD